MALQSFCSHPSELTCQSLLHCVIWHKLLTFSAESQHGISKKGYVKWKNTTKGAGHEHLQNCWLDSLEKKGPCWKDTRMSTQDQKRRDDPAMPKHLIKALTEVQNVFQSGTHCCPQGRAGCSLCAGPRWTCSRALICPPYFPRYFPHFQSQN